MMRKIDNPLLGSPCVQGEPRCARLGSPREAGGNLKEGGNQELWLRDWYNKKEGKRNLPPSLSRLDGAASY
jgi:hypothetical protein